jgi:hypothetical protein
MDVPNCSEHRRSEVVRAGWYGRVGQRRQRWWCRPVDGSAAHRFTETLPRITGGDGSDRLPDQPNPHPRPNIDDPLPEPPTITLEEYLTHSDDLERNNFWNTNRTYDQPPDLRIAS